MAKREMIKLDQNKFERDFNQTYRSKIQKESKIFADVKEKTRAATFTNYNKPHTKICIIFQKKHSIT